MHVILCTCRIYLSPLDLLSCVPVRACAHASTYHAWCKYKLVRMLVMHLIRISLQKVCHTLQELYGLFCTSVLNCMQHVAILQEL